MLARYAALVLALSLPALASAQGLAEQKAVRYLQSNWNRHGLEQADVAELVVTDRVPGLNGVEHVYLRQAIGGVEVASGPLSVAVDRHGRVFHAAGRLTPGLAQKVSGAMKSASLSPEAAATALAQAAGVALKEPFRATMQKATADHEAVLSDGGVTRLPVRARLVYAEDGGALRLAWETTLFLRSGGDWFGQIDAATGRVIRKADLLVRESLGLAPTTPRAATPRSPAAPEASGAAPMVPYASRVAQAFRAGGATYRVYAAPGESPLYGTPVPPGDARVVVSGQEDPTASPLGWHDTNGAAGAEYTITRGNNAHAYLDRDDDERPDADGEPDGGASLTFDFPLDLSQGPLANKDASVTDLFYWSNVIHDVMYQYGFDEASGNFQMNNYGRGGANRDPVDAESQSGADVCNENSPCDANANFSTPPDGNKPRMQMYIGSGATPAADGVFDHSVVVHEYGHGVSTRLTGGPSNSGCLFNPEQMGEGWSDFYGLMMTAQPGHTREMRRPVGNYLLGQDQNGGGIRSAPYQGASYGAPYSTDFAVNSLTYGDTNADSFIDGLSAPHGIGLVWATILWEATWDMIDAYGFDPDLYDASGTAGNQMMMALVTTGLKLQPCNPGFVDGRDAILAADQALYGGAHTELLWAAFARRGLGLGADQGSSASRTDQVESFVVPEDDPPAPITDLAAVPNGDFVTLTFTATGDDGTVGQAEEYLVRVSASPILTEPDWDAATPVASRAEPQPSGTAESFDIPGLDFSTEYHFAIKAVDDSSNPSPVSNSASATTLGPPDLQVATETIRLFAQPDETAEADLVIGNTGEGDLRFSIELEKAPASLALRRQPVASGAEARLADAPAPQHAPEAKGARTESAPTSGAAKSAGAGGPDAFGYRWIDSDEPGGPAYEWVDIAASGTELSLEDDDSEEVTIPFAFPFYDVGHTSVKVSSNGYLTFGSNGIAPGNRSIPSTDPNRPNDAIYAYWDDLDPANEGSPARIVYQDMGDGRFVVSWLDVPHWDSIASGGEDGAFTFQAILFEGGSIVFQYKAFDFGAFEGSATIGIENADGTVGLQVVADHPYVHEGLAVRISSFWGDAIPSAGRIASGSTETVTITADAAGLAPGVYSGVLTLRTNDPGAVKTTIPIQLTVGAAPAASLSATSVVADVARGEVASEAVTLSNTGGSPLDWALTDVSGALPDWLSLDTAGGTLAPGASVEVTMTVAPGVAYDAATTETTTLRLLSNDPAGPTEIAVTMNVLPGVATEGQLDFDGPFVLGEISPNPVGRSATAAFAVREAQTVRVEVLDLIGRRVALVQDGPVAAMTRQRIEVDAAQLAAGAYLLVVRGETFTASRRLTVAR